MTNGGIKGPIKLWENIIVKCGIWIGAFLTINSIMLSGTIYFFFKVGSSPSSSDPKIRAGDLFSINGFGVSKNAFTISVVHEKNLS